MVTRGLSPVFEETWNRSSRRQCVRGSDSLSTHQRVVAVAARRCGVVREAGARGLRQRHLQRRRRAHAAQVHMQPRTQPWRPRCPTGCQVLPRPISRLYRFWVCRKLWWKHQRLGVKATT
jgi:hypothetical protein